MTADQIAALMERHPNMVLVPVSTELLPEVVVEWVECARFRLTPGRDGLHSLQVERRPVS